jgi:hypothetical protein
MTENLSCAIAGQVPASAAALTAGMATEGLGPVAAVAP